MGFANIMQRRTHDVTSTKLPKTIAKCNATVTQRQDHKKQAEYTARLPSVIYIYIYMCVCVYVYPHTYVYTMLSTQAYYNTNLHACAPACMSHQASEICSQIRSSYAEVRQRDKDYQAALLLQDPPSIYSINVGALIS